MYPVLFKCEFWGRSGLSTLTLVLLIRSAFANSVDPDQLASEEANWSGSALFAIQYVNLYQQSGSSNLIGWKLEMGVAVCGILIYSAWQVLSLSKMELSTRAEVKYTCINL